MTTERVQLATEALRLALEEPGRARALALAAQGGASVGPPGEVDVIAEQALGLSARSEGRLADAVDHLERASSLAALLGLTTRGAEAKVSLAGTLIYLGRTDEALHALDEAAPALRRSQPGVVEQQRAGFLSMLGRAEEALQSYASALRAARRAGDRLVEARACNNRGLLHIYRADFRHAERDLARAATLYEELGAHGSAASSMINRGLAAARQGDLPRALQLYDEAADLLTTPLQRGPLALSRGETLLAAGLADDARTLAARTCDELRRAGMESELTQALLLLASAALLTGAVEESRAAAETSLRLATAQGRPGWASLARHAMVRAWAAAGETGVAAYRQAARAADELAQMGLQHAAVDAHVIAGRIALARGRVDDARTHLATASRARRHGTTDLRVRAWHADALLRLSQGDRIGAESALRAGLRVVEEQRASLGASELRSHLSAHAIESAELGLRLSLADGRPATVLKWMERLRGNALRTRPVRPPDDAALAAELASLRHAEADLREAALAGGDTSGPARRQRELEAAIRGRALRRGAGARGRATRGPALSTLPAALGARALVELASLDGVLVAVVVAGRRTSLHVLAGTPEVLHELEQVRFALRRLTYARGGPASAEAARTSMRTSGRRLDELLLVPLRARIGDRPLVIVPTGALHVVPWAILPSVRERPVTVAPSATLWLSAAQTRPPTPRTPPVLVAGPDLAHAGREIEGVARHHPGARRFVGARATVAAVGAALDGAGLAHLATHGTFRADNPLFSNLRLVDGSLTVYDLERLRRPPDHLVLSACQSGLSAVRPGDELMGLAATLLSLGCRTLVASVLPVPDAATRRLMLAYHRHLSNGAEPGVALARAQAGMADPVGAAGFVCFGLG